MSNHPAPTVERHCDVAVVGGSAAGLAAALQLVRQRRSVIVLDAGDPRNAPAEHMHGYLGYEGASPAELTGAGREEVRRYGGEVLPARVVDVTRTDAGEFAVEVVGGHRVRARRVLAATGIVDELPAIEGLAEHWGRDVLHCPFCHGFEVRDRRVVQIVTHPMNLHVAGLMSHLTASLTVVLHAAVEVDDVELDRLVAAGVTVVRGEVVRVLEDATGALSAVELVGGERVVADAAFVGTRFRPRVEPFVGLGLEAAPHPSGLGDVVERDLTGATSVPGLYAAGNVTDPSQQVLHAAADGSRVGAMIASSLVAEDLASATMAPGARPSGNRADWDHRHAGARMWSGNPNGSLVQEASGLAPGRALEVGAGEGADALWLAEQGWSVTASDISAQALAQVTAEAERRSLAVVCHSVDANALDAFDRGAFDLVTAQYASIPRTPDDRAAANLLAAVAPGGTLLVVGHDLAPMRTPVDTRTHSRMFDADAFVRVDDVAAVVAASAEWEVEVHETRPRPPGAASSHHVDDVVLRARRSAHPAG